MYSGDLEPRAWITFRTLLHPFEAEEVEVSHLWVGKKRVNFLTDWGRLGFRVPPGGDGVDENVAAGRHDGR